MLPMAMTVMMLQAPCFVFDSMQAMAAQVEVITVSGQVVDTFGEPIIGASVIVDGARGVGTVTDVDGNFQLRMKPGSKLRISFVGYVTQEAMAQDGMKVTLAENNTMLDGVEVVAYGVQKKVTVTGAIASVKSEDLTRTPVSSVSQVLAGQMTGISAIQYSGEPGSDAATIYLRGKATFSSEGVAPLIQVDGVERSMDDIDPEEIESITVLKDASATAVFGVRGANGVILITTKRGKEGKPKINFSSSISSLLPTKLVEQANSYEYATFYNMMNDNDGQTHMFSDEIVQKFKDGSDPIRFPSTNWTDYIMKDATMQTQHNVSISGGTDRARYFVSMGYYSQGGLFKQFDMPYDCTYQYKRYNYRSNLDLDVTKTTTLSLSIAGNKGTKEYPYAGQGGSSDLIKNIYYATPFSSPGIVDGKFIRSTTDYQDGLNLPFVGGTGMAYYGTGFRHSSNDKLAVDLEVKQKLDFITKGLNFHIKGSYNSTYSTQRYGAADLAVYYPVLQDDGSMGYKKSGRTTSPSYSLSTGKGRDFYFETGFNWNRSFGKHTISALALYNQSKTYYPSTYSDIPRGYVGLVGRLTYDWSNRYMAEFNIGYNGSENFHPDRRFAAFPAGSVGWIASEEDFFEPIKDIIPYMKVRASWGLVGNDKIGGNRFMYTADPYNVDTSTMPGKGGYAYDFGIENSTVYKAAYLSAMNNPDVTWEKAFKQDYGLDMNFLDNRLTAVFDYYYEDRTDILLQDGTNPVISGYNNKLPYANLGEVESWGYELSLKWQDKIGENFRYWIGANLSYNQNEIIEKKEAPQQYEYQYQKGNRIGSRSMYTFYGFYSAETEERYKREFGVSEMPVNTLVSEMKEGDAVYVDRNGDGKVDANDMGYGKGHTDDPEYTLGVNMGFAWRNLSLNMQWTGACNVTRMLDGNFRYPFYSNSTKEQGGLLKYIYDNSWTPTHTDAEYPRVSMENYLNNYATSTLYEKDAKYLRLKTVALTYDFHFAWMKTVGLSKLQFGLSGYNLLTFTPYIWGDPESRASTAPTYPLTRTVTAQLKFGF